MYFCPSGLFGGKSAYCHSGIENTTNLASLSLDLSNVNSHEGHPLVCGDLKNSGHHMSCQNSTRPAALLCFAGIRSPAFCKQLLPVIATAPPFLIPRWYLLSDLLLGNGLYERAGGGLGKVVSVVAMRADGSEGGGGLFNSTVVARCTCPTLGWGLAGSVWTGGALGGEGVTAVCT